jgi:hypothetical protein
MVLKVRAARAEVIERMRNVRVPRKDKKQGFPTAEEYAEGLLALEREKPRPLIVLFNRAAHAALAGGANQTKDQKLAQPAEEQQLGVKQQLGADAAQPARKIYHRRNCMTTSPRFNMLCQTCYD